MKYSRLSRFATAPHVTQTSVQSSRPQIAAAAKEKKDSKRVKKDVKKRRESREALEQLIADLQQSLRVGPRTLSLHIRHGDKAGVNVSTNPAS